MAGAYTTTRPRSEYSTVARPSPSDIDTCADVCAEACADACADIRNDAGTDGFARLALHLTVEAADSPADARGDALALALAGTNVESVDATNARENALADGGARANPRAIAELPIGWLPHAVGHSGRAAPLRRALAQEPGGRGASSQRMEGEVQQKREILYFGESSFIYYEYIIDN